MSGGVYGGDEVGALVFDPGHFSLRYARQWTALRIGLDHSFFGIRIALKFDIRNRIFFLMVGSAFFIGWTCRPDPGLVFF